jgi:hypothetical protein
MAHSCLRQPVAIQLGYLVDYHLDILIDILDYLHHLGLHQSSKILVRGL